MTDWLYEHTQRAMAWTLMAVLILAIVVVAFLVADGSDPGVVAVVLVLTALVALVTHGASRLTTRVDEVALEVTFTFGWPSKRIDRRDIVSHEIVRNPFWYGFGVRYIGRGWMWNVWGLDAVELQLTSGKRFRIGTDDAAGLDEALSD